MKAALLALLIAQPAHVGVDGGVVAIDVERAELTTDAGVMLVGPGVWLEAGRAIEVQRDRVSLRQQNELLQADVQASHLQTALLASGLGLVVGVALGIAFARLHP